MDFAALAGRVGPILAFVVCITVVAELSNSLGVFAMVARAAARLARGSVLALWLLVVLVAVVATAVLSLDTTAVLLTPVVLALAAQLGLDRELFALTAVWLANTASLLLPVSNLTNLLALSRLPGYDATRFAGLSWPAALACVVVTVAALALLFRRSLRGRYTPVPAPPVADRRLLVLATVVCALLGPAFLLGVDVVVASAVAAGVLVVACAVSRPSLLRWRLLPWPLVLGVAVLFVVVQYAHDHGLAELLTRAAGEGEGWTALLRVAALGALGANLLDNLPSYLALEPAADGSPLRLLALLVGVNAGPLVTPWASLATLLWAARCRAAGVAVSWGRFALRGLVLVPLLLLAAVTALWLAQA
ncbi:SLC13 family permease [Microlunatus capsulatus]|uniref:Arsenical pump membrane protein n=1 Tax=Microlunatus capsulatus TaxID=99117 RepID=A0ABS4Z2E8_9ACTN|nr:SLC13 family permease [Microlunatus capsulatus]MBP2415218.1 arsenical pump membrane protein [Microlunatus capsulatus]